MGARLRSWWQQIKQHRVAILVGTVVLVVAIALIIIEVWFYGTGFNGYNQVTTAHTISGPSAGTVTRTEVYQPGKTLYETNLTNANLSGARLNGSDLRYTNLTGADLTGTEFAGALVTEEQLKKAKSLKGATMPDGSIHP